MKKVHHNYATYYTNFMYIVYKYNYFVPKVKKINTYFTCNIVTVHI